MFRAGQEGKTKCPLIARARHPPSPLLKLRIKTLLQQSGNGNGNDDIWAKRAHRGRLLQPGTRCPSRGPCPTPAACLMPAELPRLPWYLLPAMGKCVVSADRSCQRRAMRGGGLWSSPATGDFPAGDDVPVCAPVTPRWGCARCPHRCSTRRAGAGTSRRLRQRLPITRGAAVCSRVHPRTLLGRRRCT